MTNRLAESTSPYLRQHADNPVDWHEWGPGAFAEARERGVPIFLSVGYSACHWCHVMAHESFSDPATAKLLNDNFVSIKVDREERPDVDAVYMQATTALTGQGGWPMSVFLTAEGKPFYAGTYFPAVPHPQLPSFGQLLNALIEAWQGRRDEIDGSADAIAAELAKLSGSPAPGEVALDHEADLGAALGRLTAAFDPENAGFGGAPKFPPSMVVDALLETDDPQARQMAMATLDAMSRGGICDQLGGGFARYSVDAQWMVPHFEKMLYDNALLLGTYSRAWAIARNPNQARVCRQLVEWLEREMLTGPPGRQAFAASLDADSLDGDGHSKEGAFYAWNPAQLEETLGDDWQTAATGYGVTDEGTFEEGFSTLQGVFDVPEGIRQRLLAAREQRPRPARDDKVVAAWNGWMIESLVTAAMQLEEPRWLKLATDAAETVWQLHWIASAVADDAEGGRLRRTSIDGAVGSAAGVLEDYGALAHGMLRLAAATTERIWIDRARLLLSVVDNHFGAPDGGWYDTADDAEALLSRPREFTDNATPSGASATIAALRLLAGLTGEPEWHRLADTGFAASSALLTEHPRFAGWLLRDAVVASTEPGFCEVAVVGAAPDASTGTTALSRTAWCSAPAGSVVVTADGPVDGFGVLEGKSAAGAYVCHGFRCEAPVESVEELEKLLRPAG